jgi:hypothetical protein
MYEYYELKNMNTHKLRKLCIAKCKQNGKLTSWVQFANKSDKMKYMLDGTIPKREPQETPRMTEPTIKVTPKSDGLTDMLVGAVMENIGSSVSETVNNAVSETQADLLKKVDAKISSLQRPIEIHINDVKVSETGGLTHESFPLVVECLKHFGRVWLCGPSGTGKSHLVEQSAKALGFNKDGGNYHYVKGSAGVTESHLTGRMTFDGTFIDGLVSKPFRDGNFLFLDEFDGFDANCGLVFNSVFDGQGILSTPNDRNNPMVLKNDGFNVAVATNTWGDGNDFDYAGRGQLDLATLDRLQAVKVYIDYDKNIERALVGDFIETANMLWDLRSRTNANAVKRTISTRLFLDGQRWRKVGKSNDWLLDMITLNWTDMEKDKVAVDELKRSYK